ncbi:NADPH:quinone oxidoreductase family protein [Bradyrhizobium vignae]|uniref:Alcohol dehydrogenase, zinc-binding domain protein n=1 Tax=Bradyrhizobium vignae TaxID=1549949 RepID=A0A2U3Q9H5_9BRAD|nr:NADPH:quinone oxidoreductase family protein [Bradyrhizobium vignae]SPP98101.1 Alcohol dehydrogenase, zinc-binding domain protein [Bradyrhizobium vignae]
MKGFVCRQSGEPSVLEYEEVPSRPLDAGEIRIEVRAADAGFHDTLMIAGRYQRKPAFPFIPGEGVAGTVRECGESASGHAVGDRVVARLPSGGGFAEEAIVLAGAAITIPEVVSFAEAAVLSASYATAYQGLVDRAQVCRGEVLLVRGAAGGVGRAAVEIGYALGALVIAAASSPEKLSIARRAGASHLINTTTEDVRGRVLEITEGRGADVIFDTVGTDFKQACLRCVARRGRILVVGFAGGEIPLIPAHYMINKFCAVLGVAMSYATFEKEPAHYRQVIGEVLRMRANARIGPLLVNTVGAGQLVAALGALSSRSSLGSTVLTF